MQKGHKTTKRGINVNPKFGKRLSALLLSAAVAAGSVVSAGACCGLYIGSDETVTGSTYVGRSEDIGKLYDKVFEVIPAADHAAGAMFEDSYGFSMPYPAHTYRYTVMRDSVNRGETMTDANGNIIEIAYGEVGMNEKGVAVSATVSTDYNKAAEAADPLNEDSGLCEISLNSVILMQADSARDGVEKLAKILDAHGAGECNSLTISDADEVWDFEILSGYQYVAVKMPKDKVSVNPNMVIMNEIDTADTENVIASKDLIALPQEKGFLVSSQVPATGVPAGQKITKIDVQKTYGAEDFGDGQYVRYWQGVNYLNKTLSNNVDIYRANADTAPVGPFNMLFDADRKLDTYDALRLLAYRGEGTEYDANTRGNYAIGNERQAECHVFEIRDNMPEALATIQWQTMSRAEFSVYLPYYSNLLTDTSDIFKNEYYVNKKEVPEITQVLDNKDFPADTSAYWVFAAINDLCDNDRDRYGVNVKKFWENYQKELIKQQAAVDTEMVKLYKESPAKAEAKATELGKAVSEEAFGYAKSILSELRAFIKEHGSDKEVFMPTVLKENKLPTYSFDMKVKKSFDDVVKGAWYENSVDYVVDNGLMNGTDATRFEPDSTTTRAMLMTVIARYAGEDTTGSNPWYQKGMEWAKANGVSDGTAPNANITREQLVTMLYRYAKSTGKDVSVGEDTNIRSYADATTVSEYAVPAMQWACGAGIVNGSNGKLNPQNNATRAEVAAILMRFCENVK